MPSGFFLKKKPPCTPLNTARVLEKCSNASEVMRAALRSLERQEQEYEQKMAILRKAIAEGDASSDAEPGVFERLDAYIDELAAAQGEHVA
jgi:putative addiction module CopG family antidote